MVVRFQKICAICHRIFSTGFLHNEVLFRSMPEVERILEDSNFDFRHVKLCDLDIARENWLNYLQTFILWRP